MCVQNKTYHRVYYIRRGESINKFYTVCFQKVLKGNQALMVRYWRKLMRDARKLFLAKENFSVLLFISILVSELHMSRTSSSEKRLNNFHEIITLFISLVYFQSSLVMRWKNGMCLQSEENQDEFLYICFNENPFLRN
jgi:hypothetical protein